jgi:hypothetical protein
MVYGFNKLNNNFVVHNSHADSYKTTQTSRTATIPLKPVGIRGIETTPEVIEKAPWHSEDLQVERHSPKHHRLGLPSLAPPCSIAPENAIITYCVESLESKIFIPMEKRLRRDSIR